MISSKLMRTNALELYIKPNARENRIEGLYGGRIKIRIASPPENGKANRELIKFLSGITGVSKNEIKIISGVTSNYKKIIINGGKTPDYFKMLLDNS